VTIDLSTSTSELVAVDELATILPGQVFDARHPDWRALSSAWNLQVPQQPRAVVAATDEEDVVATVQWARRHGLTVSAQPVGHGATTALTGTVLVRTRGLGEITVDAANRVARVGAGVKWGELLAATAPYGLTGLAGSSPDPSVVGFSLGGGLSWFGRAHGLAAHSILAVELVDASGELRRVTAASDPDLFWALRGGGGDFGIVTAMEIVLHPASHVYGGRLLWPIEMARPVLTAFRQITATAPETLTLWAHLLRFPPFPEIPEPLRGGSFVSVDIAHLGGAEEAEELLAPLRSLPALRADSLGTVPLAELGGICAEPVDPMPIMELSGLLRDIDDAAIDRLLAAAGGPQSPLLVVQIRHLGGALARATEADGPAGAIHEPYQLFCLGIPVTPDVTAAVTASFGAIREALTGHLTGRRTYNFLADNDDPTDALSHSALTRLASVKQTVDPNGRFRSNRPVRHARG
jgi:FAD/FMN-containing dehydrogenase